MNESRKQQVREVVFRIKVYRDDNESSIYYRNILQVTDHIKGDNIMYRTEFQKRIEITNKLNLVRDTYRSLQSEQIIHRLQDMITFSMIDMDTYSLPDSCMKYVVEYDYIDITVSGYNFAKKLDEVLNIDLGFVGDTYFYELDRSGYVIDQECVSEYGDTYLLRIDNVWSYLK